MTSMMCRKTSVMCRTTTFLCRMTSVMCRKTSLMCRMTSLNVRSGILIVRSCFLNVRRSSLNVRSCFLNVRSPHTDIRLSYLQTQVYSSTGFLYAFIRQNCSISIIFTQNSYHSIKIKTESPLKTPTTHPPLYYSVSLLLPPISLYLIIHRKANASVFLILQQYSQSSQFVSDFIACYKVLLQLSFLPYINQQFNDAFQFTIGILQYRFEA